MALLEEEQLVSDIPGYGMTKAKALAVVEYGLHQVQGDKTMEGFDHIEN